MRRLLSFLICAVSVYAQDWTARRVVAITSYAPLARQARISGDVKVRCFLDASGSVLRSEALSGHPLLKEQALENALHWKFKFQGTGSKGNDTVALTYQYRLEGELQDATHTVFIVDLPNTIQIIAPVAWVQP